MIGRKLSNFHINERIGEGGMGTVYKATDLSLNRTVAIKMLHPFLVNNPDSFKRFRNEAHLSARISHPNVATLFDFQESDNSHFIVMEYVQGKALDDILKIQGKLPEEEAIKITVEVLEGLGAAHELGIMHRDLKPGNIMVTQRGFVKLMDFGIARLENTERMTRQNSVIGTLEYLSPELIKGGAPSKGSDLYAVGVMLYEMISGKTLFAGDSEAALMYQIAHKQPNFQVSGHNRSLIKVIKKLTHKQVSKRYQSTQEVISDLEKIHRGGKVNTLLLRQKMEPAKKLARPKVSLPVTPKNLDLAALKQLKVPFDIDLRILAGAAVLCLFILIMGISRSGKEPGQSEQPAQQEIANSGDEESPAQADHDPLFANNFPDSRQPKSEITFIEKFEDEPEVPKEENSLREDTRQLRERESSAGKQKSEKDTRRNEEIAKKTPVERKESVTEKKQDPLPKTVIAEVPEKKKETIQENNPPEKVEKRTIIPEKEPERKPTGSVKIRMPDTYISARFTETISTEKNHEGQTVYLKTSSPIYHGEHLVIPQGSQVRAIVKKLRKSDGGKKAFLAINLLEVQAVNGDWLTVSYPEYSNLSKTVVEFDKGLQLNQIKLKSTNITLNY